MIIEININIDKIMFSILKIENERKIRVIEDKIVIPKSFSIGDKLKYIRKFIKTFIKIYNVKKSYIKLEDYKQIEIIKIKGIIEEVCSNCGVILCK